MKKLLTLLAAILTVAAFCSESFAQGRFGIMGGANFSKLNVETIKSEALTRYHVGITYQLKLPLGFSIQPSLLYQVKGGTLGSEETADAKSSADITVGYLELPVSFQWGPDLLLFRPFVDVTPFVGYGLNNKITFDATTGVDQVSLAYKNKWDSQSLKRFEYGIGLGIGLEIWKVQVIGRYNWNLGSLYDIKESASEGFTQVVKDAVANKNFGGFTITASILF